MRRVAWMGVALVLLAISAGCLGIAAEPDRSDRAEATLADVNSTIQEVTTYRAETDLHATAVAEGEELTRDATIVGDVNATQKRSKTTLEMDGETRTAYIDDRTVYQECESPWGWANTSMDSDGHWIRATTLGRHVEILDSGDLRLEQSASHTGEGTVTLVGNPSKAALEAYREDRAQPAIGDMNVEDVTVRLIVDNGTHRPVRGSMSFEAVGDGATATVTMETTFSDYGEPMQISIPANVTETEFDWEGGCPGA